MNTGETNSKRLIAAIWEYAGEIILAILLCVFIYILVDIRSIGETLCKFRIDFLTAIGVCLTLGVAFWGCVLTILSTDFGTKLRKAEEASAYSSAAASSVFIFLVTLLIVLFSSCSNFHLINLLNMFALIYSAINITTMIRNLTGLVRLWQDATTK